MNRRTWIKSILGGAAVAILKPIYRAVRGALPVETIKRLGKSTWVGEGWTKRELTLADYSREVYCEFDDSFTLPKVRIMRLNYELQPDGSEELMLRDVGTDKAAK